jgi:putative ABC transport system permease protein
MKALDRKLLRDVLLMKGQLAAICAVIACGVATFIMMQSALTGLSKTQADYYALSRFAQVFASCKRAPLSVGTKIDQIPGVSQTQLRVVKDVTLDVKNLAEPAVGRLISLPEDRQPGLNQLYIRVGRYIEPRRPDEALVSEGFAKIHGLQPGDKVTAIINGRRKDLEIVGIALSPEYVYQIRQGLLVPDDKRFGIFWMGEEALSTAFDMEGAFNDICLDLTSDANEAEVLRDLDRITRPYGGWGAIGRRDQISNKFISDEINNLKRMGLIIPGIFLLVAAFLLNVVLSRIIALQRDQIAALKAFGYSNLAVGWHFLKLVILIVIVGELIGIGVGCVLGIQIMALYTKFYRFPSLVFVLPMQVVLGSFSVACGSAVVGTVDVIRRAVRLPPAEAMRPEPPANFRPTILERLGMTAFLNQTTRIILRNIERRPFKAMFSSLGIALSVAIIILGHFSTDSLNFLIELQFRVVQRHHISVAFTEPYSLSAVFELQHLPGVIRTEAVRSMGVKMRFEHHERRIGLQGIPQNPELNHLIDVREHPIALPRSGLVINTKLASVLGIKRGDVVTVEVLEGTQPTWQVPVAALVTEHFGLSAYMDLNALNRLMKDGDVVNNVSMLVDQKHVDELYQKLKETPKVASVTIKEASVRSFRETVMENMLQMQFFNLMFACVIAFGVVYNTARIALSERGRELASLRVLGLTRGEISYILLGELALLTLFAIPLGILLGYGLGKLVTTFLDTELYRVPLVVSPRTWALAVSVVAVAAVASGLVVRRKLDHLDLIAVLKTRE